jgi:Zn-dependent membrane protease YugP
MFFFDPTFILLIPAVILAFYAQAKVRGTYERFSRVPSSRGFTGEKVARQLLNMRGLGDIEVEETKGMLSDHYDPRKRVLRLSSGVYESNSVAALGIAAHETGHALQHADAYGPLMLRSNLVPVANIGTWVAFPLFLIGFFIGKSTGTLLMDIGIIFFSGAVALSLITLPVEFNASSRALVLLREGGYLSEQELPHARAVFVRLLILRGSRD